MSDKRTYSAAEVHEILRRAAEKTAARQQATSDALEYEALVEAARDAGLDPAAVEAAAREVDEARANSDVGRALRAKRRRAFLSHLSAYLIVNAGLLLISWVTTGALWSLAVTGGWGIGLAFHLLSALREPTEDEIDREKRARSEQQRELERQRRRREARARERAEKQARRAEEAQRAEEKRREKEQRQEKLRAATDAFESAVEEGVAVALHKAARQLETITKKSAGAVTSAPSDFARYVREKKGMTGEASTEVARDVGATPTGVRVEPRAEEVASRAAGDAEPGASDADRAPRDRGSSKRS
jgi:hypothetical protein